MTAARNRPEETEILILGGGYAGISAAVALRHSNASILLVNENPYHYFTTLLHQPAAGHADFKQVSLPIRQLLGEATRHLEGTVTAIQPQQRSATVSLPAGDDVQVVGKRLVIALGSEPQFYNIVGLAEHALTLRNLRAAQLIRAHIQLQLARYANEPAEAWRPHVIIGGGGWSGVELAGELADWRPRVAPLYGVEAGAVELTVIEAANSLLQGFDPLLVERAQEILAAKGVRVLLASPIAETHAEGVLLDDGRELQAGTVIWTGGVRGRQVVEACGLRVNRQGRAHVDRYLRAEGHDDLFVIGDSALSRDAEGNALPPTAQLAVQHGAHVARLLQARPGDSSSGSVGPFTYTHRGTFLSIGRREALGLLPGGRRIQGWPARWLKELAAYRYVASIGGVGMALRKWLQRMIR